MISRYDMPSKGEELSRYLTERGVHVPMGMGWRSIRCIDPNHIDKQRSASVNLAKGYYKCFACDLHGDVYDLRVALEGVTIKEALSNKPQEKTEEVWI
jgi:DNA primase